jgi:hypothetical protein
MKKPTILILGILIFLNFQINYGQSPDYLKSVTATGNGITNVQAWSDLFSITINVGDNTADTKYVLVTASINMRPDGTSTQGREANYNIYRSVPFDRSDASGIIKRQIVNNSETGVESWGIGTLVHIFDVSGLSGDISYTLEHSNQGGISTGRNVYSSARLTAVALSTAINHYELSNDVKRINDGTDDVTTELSEYAVVTGLTTNAITLPIKGDIYVTASINGKSSKGDTVAEYKLEYSDDGGTNWADLGKPVKRSMFNSFDDGIVSLVGLLQDQDAGDYIFRLAHKRISGSGIVTTHYSNLVAVALAHDNGGYFPAFYSEVDATGVNITGLSAPATTITSSIFTAASDIGSVGTNLYVNSQYLVSASGLNEGASPQQRMRAGNQLYVNDGTTTVRAEEYYRFIGDNSSFGAGGFIGLVEDLENAGTYTIGMEHQVAFVSNPDATEDETLTTSSVILTGFQTYDHYNFIWTGATNTNWSTSTNWQDGNSPPSESFSSNASVLIPTVASNYPTLTTENLSFSTGSSLTVENAASLTVESGLVFTNNGIITNNSGGTVTFKSDVSGSAYIGNGTGTFTGDFTVERFIPARRAFRFLSTPVTTTSTIRQNWQNNGVDTPGKGTHITGNGGATNGFDVTSTNNPSMFTMDNSTVTWNEITNTNITTLSAGTPYLLMVRGDRTTDISIQAPAPSPTTLSATGTLDAENTSPSALALNETAGGFSFIGNPFQAPVDMSSVLTTNTSNVDNVYYWVWDPNLNVRGGYTAIQVSDGSSVPASNANQYLQAGQAAFVQTSANGAASLTFTQASKNTTGPETAVFKSSGKKASAGKLSLSLYESSALAENKSVSDGLLILFDDDYSNAIDAFDAAKFTNLDETFATSNGGNLFSIEQRATPTLSDEIPLHISMYRDTNYTIVAKGSSLTGETPFLFDTYTNQYTEIPQDGTVNYAYNIDTSIPETIAANRFLILFSSQALSVSDVEIQEIQLYPNPAITGVFYLHVPQDIDDLELTVYNVLGVKLYTERGFKAGSKVTISTSFAKKQGLYFVKLTSKGKSITKKLRIN